MATRAPSHQFPEVAFTGLVAFAVDHFFPDIPKQQAIYLSVIALFLVNSAGTILRNYLHTKGLGLTAVSMLACVSLMLAGCATHVRVWPPEFDVAVGDSYTIECDQGSSYADAQIQTCDGTTVETRGGHGSAPFFEWLGDVVDGAVNVAGAFLPRGLAPVSDGDPQE